MPVGTSQGITLPVVGTTVGPTWASDLITALETIIDSIETPVGSSGIGIDDTLEMNGEELSEAGAIGFEDKSSSFTGASNVKKVYSRDGELYWNDAAGNSVKLTSNGALNAASIGGIGGDYGADPASLDYVASSSKFLFEQDPGVNADVDVASVLLRQATAGANAITVKSPNSLAASINRTLLAANPASTSILLVSSAGTESATRDPSVDSITATTGAIATLTTSVDIKHSHTLVLQLSAAHGRPHPSASWTQSDASSQYFYWTANSVSPSSRVYFDIPLKVGDRITQIDVYGLNAGATAFTAQFYANKYTDGTGGTSGSAATSSPAPSVSASVATLTPNYTIIAGTFVYVGFIANAVNNLCYGVKVTYTRP